MTDVQLTNELAQRVLGWKPSADRFIKSDRGWVPKWRFQPLSQVASAFELLDEAAERYRITCERGTFSVEVHSNCRRGEASGDVLGRTISIAVAGAIGLELAK